MTMAIRVATLTTPGGASLVFSNIEDSMDDHQAWLTDLSGFYGGVGVSDPGSQRKLGHGFFAMPSLRTGRALTLSGTITFKTEQLRTLADRFISGQLWDGDFGTLTVQTDEQVLSCKVKLDGEIKHSYHGVSALQVQIPLTAPDPFLYASPRLYQIFPAGAGEGLVYPLFTTKGKATSDNLSGFASTATSNGTVTTEQDGRQVLTVTREGNSFPGSFVLTSVPTTPGKNYTVKTRVQGSAPGTSYALRTNIVGGSYASTKYFVTDSSGNIIVPAPVDSWDERAWNVTMPQGSTSIYLTWFPIHPNDSQVGTQSITVEVMESTPVLDWGAGAPMGGAFANQGNATAYPEITVRGDFPAGFSIVESGRTLTYSSPVHASSPVTIDNREGAVYVDGIDQTYRLTQRDWLEVKAGSAIQPRITALAPSNGWADITISDTYI